MLALFISPLSFSVNRFLALAFVYAHWVCTRLFMIALRTKGDQGYASNRLFSRTLGRLFAREDSRILEVFSREDSRTLEVIDPIGAHREECNLK